MSKLFKCFQVITPYVSRYFLSRSNDRHLITNPGCLVCVINGLDEGKKISQVQTQLNKLHESVTAGRGGFITMGFSRFLNNPGMFVVV